MLATPTPKPYQRDGIDFLRQRARAILADDAGLGKSMQLITAANEARAERILVIAPAIGRVSWALQFETWDTTNRPVFQYPQDTLGLVPSGPVALIVTMDWLASGKNGALFNETIRLADKFDVLFVDEAHFLKTPDAKRTVAVYGDVQGKKDAIVQHCTRTWIATATPTPLNAGELYPHLRALFPEVLGASVAAAKGVRPPASTLTGRLGLFDPDLNLQTRRMEWRTHILSGLPAPDKIKAKRKSTPLPNLFKFQEAFCVVRDGPYGRTIHGNDPQTIHVLKDALKPHMLSRRKADVLPDLDPIVTDLLPVEVKKPATTPVPRGMAAGVVAAAAMLHVDDNDFLKFMGSVVTTDANHAPYSTARRELGEAKAAEVVPWIKDFLNADKRRKLVVFAHHRSVIKQLYDALHSQDFFTATITGDTPANTKAEEVRRFQEDKGCRLFIGQTRAAGTAITLTAASDVLLIEPDPSPDNNYQAISRCHRIGQTSSVTARFVYAAKDPVDKRLAQILRRRATDAAELFGGDARGHIPQSTTDEDPFKYPELPF